MRDTDKQSELVKDHMDTADLECPKKTEALAQAVATVRQTARGIKAWRQQSDCAGLQEGPSRALDVLRSRIAQGEEAVEALAKIKAAVAAEKLSEFRSKKEISKPS